MDIESITNTIINDDCINILKQLPDKCIDAIICDLPYGTTACSWDSIIPFDKLWEQYKRIIIDEGVIVLFGNEPFSSKLRCSNLEMYRYDWKWNKKRGYNFQQANYAPMRNYEDICVFSKKPAIYCKSGSCRYFPIKTDTHIIHKSGTPTKTEVLRNGADTLLKPLNKKHKGFFPKAIIEFEKDKENLHPTQKPVALIEYLIKTYTNENDLVLDNCSGSGSLAVACYNTKRNFICIEKDYDYWKASVERLENAQAQLKLF